MLENNLDTNNNDNLMEINNNINDSDSLYINGEPDQINSLNPDETNKKERKKRNNNFDKIQCKTDWVAGLNINGTSTFNDDVYISTSTKGIILTSPNGSCWRESVSNIGILSMTSITCP